MRGNQTHRLKVLHQVVFEPVDRSICDVGAPLADADRVAIRRGAGDTTFSDRATSTRRVLDDDCLAKHLAHALRHDARNHVGRAADA